MHKEKPAGFLNYLHSFRGFATICIVAGHAVSALYLAVYNKYDWSDPVLIINELFFNQCTLFFALISGLLFSSVLKHKSYKEFYRSKVLYVFLPYVFFTLLYTFVKFQRHLVVYLGHVNDMDAIFKKVSMNLLSGRANFVLWYIPVLFGLYLLTPCFGFLFRHKKQTIVLIWMIILAPLISSAFKIPTIYGLVLSKIIYFSGAYVLGMYLGEHLETSMHWVRSHVIQLICAVCACTLLLGYVHYYNIIGIGRLNLQDALYYIQKVCLAALMLLYFRQLEGRQPVWLENVAAYSTPVYFIHGAIVFSCASLFVFVGKEKQYASLNIFLGAVALLVVTIGLSMLVAALIKKIFGKKSRMILGA